MTMKLFWIVGAKMACVYLLRDASVHSPFWPHFCFLLCLWSKSCNNKLHDELWCRSNKAGSFCFYLFSFSTDHSVVIPRGKFMLPSEISRLILSLFFISVCLAAPLDKICKKSKMKGILSRLGEGVEEKASCVAAFSTQKCVVKRAYRAFT